MPANYVMIKRYCSPSPKTVYWKNPIENGFPRRHKKRISQTSIRSLNEEDYSSYSATQQKFVDKNTFCLHTDSRLRNKHSIIAMNTYNQSVTSSNSSIQTNRVRASVSPTMDNLVFFFQIDFHQSD